MTVVSLSPRTGTRDAFLLPLLRLGVVALAAFLALATLAPRSARADTPFDGKWREGALREDYTVQQWTPTSCGPAPVSAATGGGDVVSVHQEGDELAIAGGGRVYRTNQCYDQLPTLARETHSRDASGRSWRTRCSTPPSDPRRATMNTLVIASSDSHIDIIETGRYEIVLQDARCIADVRRSRTFDLVALDQAAPAASASAPPPLASVAPIPPPAPAHAACDSPGAPARLEVRPSRKLLRTGESFLFHAQVLDADGCATATATTWTLAPGAGGTTLLVDPSGRVTAPVDAAEGSAQIVVSAAGRSARVTVDVTSAAHYDDLLAKSGLNSQGENDAASVAELATGSLGASDARAEDTAKQRRLLFIAIVGGLALALGVTALIFSRRQKRAAALEKEAEEAYEEKVRQAEVERAAKRSAHDAAVRAHQESLQRAQDAARAAAQREAESRTSAVPSMPGGMVCPTCRREYPKTSAYCPQDATKLVPFQGESSGGTAGSICPACKRGFPAGTKVCPQDGEELVPYAMHAAVVAQGGASPAAPPRGKICPTCGGRFDGNATFCGKDGTALVLIN
jgi:hypothetical protein